MRIVEHWEMREVHRAFPDHQHPVDGRFVVVSMGMGCGRYGAVLVHVSLLVSE